MGALQEVNTHNQWNKLDLESLRMLGRWLDWAEHPAMREVCVLNGERGLGAALAQWRIEISTLAQTETQIREIYEERTGSPPCIKTLF